MQKWKTRAIKNTNSLRYILKLEKIFSDLIETKAFQLKILSFSPLTF